MDKSRGPLTRQNFLSGIGNSIPPAPIGDSIQRMLVGTDQIRFVAGDYIGIYVDIDDDTPTAPPRIIIEGTLYIQFT